MHERLPSSDYRSFFLLLTAQRRKPLLINLDDNSGIAVRRLTHLIFSCGAKDLGHFRGSQLVVFHEPIGHVYGCTPKSAVEGAVETHRHDMRGGFDAGTVHAFARDNVYAEFHV